MEYERLRSVVVGRLRGSGASREDAEDCAQEALLAAWTAHQAGRGPDDLQAWTTTVARRRFVDLGRRRAVRRRAVRRSHTVAVDEHDRTARTPEQAVVEQAHAHWLAGRLAELPAATRQVCELALDGHSRSAIATRMGISLPSADSHLTRARRFLRRQAALVGAALTSFGACWKRKQTAGLVSLAAATATATVALGPAPSTADEPDGREPGEGIVGSQQVSGGGPERRPARDGGTAGTVTGPSTVPAPVTPLTSSPRPSPARSRISEPSAPLPISPRTILTVELRPERFRHDVADAAAAAHGLAPDEVSTRFGSNPDPDAGGGDGPFTSPAP